MTQLTPTTSTILLKQARLRGPVELMTEETQDAENPAVKLTSQLAIGLQALVDEHEALPPNEAEIAAEYTTDISITYNPVSDLCSLSVTMDPPIHTDDLAFVPDSYQMASYLITLWLEQVGAIAADGEVNEEFVDRSKVH